MAELVQRAIRLGARLERIAAVDKERGLVGQNRGHAGRAGEAGEPGEPLRPRWDVFALMLVGPRHETSLHPLAREFSAQPCEAFRGRKTGRRSGAAQSRRQGTELRLQL